MEKVNGLFKLKRNHNYYFQVQQQLFTLPERMHCDFVVCGIDSHLNAHVVSGEFVQILHTGSNHWVCISNIGCLPGKVHLYGSLFHDVISQEIEDQTNDLLGGDLVSLEFVPVQQQTNDSDCGVFAIAFAVSLALGTDPMHVTFDVQRMRLHLAACLKDKKLNMFPIF